MILYRVEHKITGLGPYVEFHGFGNGKIRHACVCLRHICIWLDYQTRRYFHELGYVLRAYDIPPEEFWSDISGLEVVFNWKDGMRPIKEMKLNRHVREENVNHN